jgi:hypothetical protein
MKTASAKRAEKLGAATPWLKFRQRSITIACKQTPRQENASGKLLENIFGKLENIPRSTLTQNAILVTFLSAPGYA